MYSGHVPYVYMQSKRVYYLVQLFQKLHVWEHTQNLVQMHFQCCVNALESCSSSFQTLSQRVWFLVWTCLPSRWATFGFSFEHVCLLVETRLASRSNASRLWLELVHTWSECVQTKNALYLVSDWYCSTLRSSMLSFVLHSVACFILQVLL